MVWSGLSRLPHRRTPEGEEQRRRRWEEAQARKKLWSYAKKLILNLSKRDVIWAETVCRSDRIEIVELLIVNYPRLSDIAKIKELPRTSEAQPIPNYCEKGLVLVDSRGNGVLQQ